MSVIPAPAEATHSLGQASFTSLATPSRGSSETAVWRVELAPHTPPSPHSLTREEVFVVMEGRASVQIAGVPATATTGDAIVVPADVDFELANTTDSPLVMLCCLPVGGQGRMPGGQPFTPPWAQ